jgi:hypothetical protein
MLKRKEKNNQNQPLQEKKSFPEIDGFVFPSLSMVKFFPHHILLKKTLWYRIYVVMIA